MPALAFMPLAQLATKAGGRARAGVLHFASLDWTIDATRVEETPLPTYGRVLAVFLAILRRFALAGFPVDGFVQGPIAELLGEDSDGLPESGVGTAPAGGQAGGWQRRDVWRELAYLRDARFLAGRECKAGVLGEQVQLLTTVALSDGRNAVELAEGADWPHRASHWRVCLSPAIVTALRATYLHQAPAEPAGRRCHTAPPVLDWSLVRVLRVRLRRGKRQGVAHGAALPLYYWLEARRALGRVDLLMSERGGRQNVADHELVSSTFECFVSDVYRGVGGTSASNAPSTAWRALRAAHGTLYRHKVLREDPDPTGRPMVLSDGRVVGAPNGLATAGAAAGGATRAPRPWTPSWLTYVLAPGRPTGERALVEWLARSYGVWANVTAGFLSDPRGAEVFVQILAAATIGILSEPESTLGRQITGIAKKQRVEAAGGRIDDSGRRFIPRAGELAALQGPVLNELRRLATVRGDRLNATPAADRRLRELEALYSRPGRQSWVVQGLVAAHVNRAFGLVPRLPRRPRA